ncbi:MAG TPA: hypothetical protein DEO83_06610 [Lachnospiraceae bacterium]|nr:hypothetical protein [Lachnospiraceae bacterium]
MEQEKSKINIAFLARIILVTVVILIVGLSVFLFVRLRIGAKDALRDAKNVRMSLRSADIEMYAAGKSVYNPGRKNGIEAGAKERAEQIYTPTGDYRITSYDTKKHEITGFMYEVDNFVVTFSKHDEAISWDVDYILRVYSYDDSDDIVNGE